MSNVMIRWPDESHDDAKRAALDAGMTFSQYARLAVAEKIDRDSSPLICAFCNKCQGDILKHDKIILLDGGIYCAECKG